MFRNRSFSAYLCLLIALLLIFPHPSYGQAHSLEAIDIFVEVGEDGRAEITELRRVNLSEGTENYIVMENLGDSEILDFRVEEEGYKYQALDHWNLNWSRDEKKHKSGVIRTSQGYELCWGIGDYGLHTYEVHYTVTNFVKNYRDSQAIFWRFINDQTNIPPETATVTIKGPWDFSDKNSAIWAFGYEGQINFSDDGKIIASSSRAFNPSNYLTILVELEKDSFSSPSAMIDKSFEEVKNKAFIGSDYDSDSDNKEKANSSSSGALIFSLLFTFIPFIIFTSFIVYLIKAPKRFKTSIKKRFIGEYYRDYPYEGPFEEIYSAMVPMGLAKRENILTAFILKWIYEGDISLEKYEKGKLIKKEETGLRLSKKSWDILSLEDQLFLMMQEAVGANQVLEDKEFTKWAKKNYTRLIKWEEDLVKQSKKKLLAQSYLEKEDKKFLFFKYQTDAKTQKGEKLEENTYKFINYLRDYSLLEEHGAINVGIWDQLMIWAAFFGITQAVSEEFKKLYPNYETESIYKTSAIPLAHSYASHASSAVTSRSSGGGGSSSSGGGGGSSGGGSGGGTR
ncbi:MAG: DUF2207 domain-containing protein [Tissierellia bacterium]|nr:DUF2207 domain-containing protein [Tissierellia bacterium]